ncbi:rhomboid family intramembrane serine protease [Aquihabitans sp. McL0605]|uniref:rhomboid family intramembrane serine protease n=1 Tax=Aquihabitans sp. McL0605 TaxID=3415671 RepID=UPI003CF835C2
MSGRYSFSLPEPRQRDGWFRIGTLDITTTVLVALVSLASMLLYAIDAELTMKGAFISELVRNGEVWRVFTWPLVNPPTIWGLIEIALFWYFGNMVEEQMGRKPMAVLLACMTVIPAAFVSLLNASNEGGNGQWAAYSFSVAVFAVVLFTLFVLDNPNARFFFGIPGWVIAAAIVGIEVLQLVSVRAWAQLILLGLVMAIGCFGAAQRGLLSEFEWIPRSKRLAGSTLSPYGSPSSAKQKSGRFGRKRAKPKRTTNAGPYGEVVSGPWSQTGGPTPLEQAELDVLLDRISAGGIDSLTAEEKARLNALSKRMRDS